MQRAVVRQVVLDAQLRDAVRRLGILRIGLDVRRRARSRRTARRPWTRTRRACVPSDAGAPPPAGSACRGCSSSRRSSGSATLFRTSICAARWQTTSKPPVAHQLRRRRRVDVDLVEGRRRRQVLAPPAREVVDDGDRVPFGEEQVGDVRADEAGSAGHESSWHVSVPRWNQEGASSRKTVLRWWFVSSCRPRAHAWYVSHARRASITFRRAISTSRCKRRRGRSRGAAAPSVPIMRAIAESRSP